MVMSNKALMLVGTAAAATFALPSFAQTTRDASESPATAEPAPAEDEGQLGDIIITAQRQSEKLQDVPIAVTALSGGQLADKGLTNSGSLEGAVPNLTMTKQGTAVRPYLRGVGSDLVEPTDEPSVATYVDGFYMATPIANSLSFNSVERIEVLKGPQGTLFGRNATGGVIQIITRDPKHEIGVEGSIGYGNYQKISNSLYATTGLSDNLAADVALIYNYQGQGYGRDLVTGSETHKSKDFAIRSKWVLDPSDATKVTLIFNYGETQSTANDFQLVPGVISPLDGSTYPGRFNNNSEFPSFLDARNEGVALRVEQDVGFARFVSSSAYTHVTELYGLDTDATPVPIIQATAREAAKSYSQEFQLLGNSDSPFQWQTGVYLFRLDGYFNVVIEGGAAAPLTFVGQTSRIRVESVAAYAQASYEILPSLKATGGLRYTRDKQSINAQVDSSIGVLFKAPFASQSSESPTWRISLDYKLSDDILAYISYNRGIKSGGFNATTPGELGYDPETLDAYEAGLKTELFDRHLRLNLAAFHYDYKNLQVSVQASPTSNKSVNAAAAKLDGIDLDFEALPFDNFTLSGGVGILRTKYKSFPDAICFNPDGSKCPVGATGNRTVNAPRFTGSVTASYVVPSDGGDFRISATVVHKSLSYATPDNNLAFPAYSVVNGVIGWTSPDERFGIQFWINNAFDEKYAQTRIEGPFGYLQSEADPRTYGARVSAKF